MADDPKTYSLIDEPSPFAPKEIIQQWLGENDLEIEAANTDGGRKPFEEAKARVLENLRIVHGPSLGDASEIP